MGDFYELWLGLFQSTVLGEIAFLNVDVNHKAFPKRYASLVDLLQDMGNIPTNQPLDRKDEDALRRHLAGLEICYNVPNAKGMVYKFMRMEGPPESVRFKMESGEEKSIGQYFRDSGRRIQYPNLNCIRLGNTIKSICVPMEFCSIPDTQVWIICCRQIGLSFKRMRIKCKSNDFRLLTKSVLRIRLGTL